MENLIWIIYFIDVLSSNGGLGVTGFLLLAGSIVVHLIIYAESNEGEAKKFKDMFPLKTVVSISVVFMIYSFIVPSKDTAYKMLAAYGVYELTQNERAKNLGGKSLEVLEAAMDEYLEDSKK